MAILHHVSKSDIWTDVKPLQLLKAFEPILVTLLGIVTEVRPLQPLKAASPILVTLLGMTRSLISTPFRKR